MAMSLSIPLYSHTLIDYIGNQKGLWTDEFLSPMVEGMPPVKALATVGILYFGICFGTGYTKYKINGGINGDKLRNKSLLIWMWYFWEISNGIGIM